MNGGRDLRRMTLGGGGNQGEGSERRRKEEGFVFGEGGKKWGAKAKSEREITGHFNRGIWELVI